MFQLEEVVVASVFAPSGQRTPHCRYSLLLFNVGLLPSATLLLYWSLAAFSDAIYRLHLLLAALQVTWICFFSDDALMVAISIDGCYIGLL
jgi:hypothetical protein